MSDDIPDLGAVDALVHARHGDPFAVLGPHAVASGTAIRAFIPDADMVEVLGRDNGLTIGTLKLVHNAGFWSGCVPDPRTYRFRVHANGTTRDIEDPYRFPPMLGDIDIYLLGEGRHRDFARVMGAHVVEIEGVVGCAVCCLGAQRAQGVRRWQLQRMGWAEASDAVAPGVWRLGVIHTGDRCGRHLQIRTAWRRWHGVAIKGRPGGAGDGAAACYRFNCC